jgi:uncharacterized repeat protein (TIGR01451 family)
MKKQLLVLACLLICQICLAINASLPPNAIIAYNTPFCRDNSIAQPVAITGTGNYTGGAFSATPTGLSISPSTGAINPSLSVAGTYVVTYTIPAGVDPEVQVTTTVQIVAVPNAGTGGNTTVCETSTTAINLFSLITGEQAGGTWTRTVGTGGTFNANAGVFIPGFGATTSIFTYTVAGISPCVSDTSTATVTVNQQPNAGYGSTVSICNDDATPINLSDILFGEQPGGTWTRTSGTGGLLNVATGVFTPTPGSTTSSTFVYSVTGPPPCSNNTATVTVNVGTEITIPGSFPNVTACMYYVLPELQMGNYYTQPGGAGQMLAPGTEINWSQMIYVYAQSGTCSGETSFFVTIFSSIIPVFEPIPDQCLGALPITLPMISTNGITGFWSPAVIDNTFAGTITYTFTPDFDNCGAPTTLTVTVVPCAGITLNAFLDVNSNGIEDSGEPKFPLGHFEYEVNDDGIIHYGTAPAGTFTLSDYLSANSYDVTYVIDAPDDVRYNITIPSYSNIVSANPIPVYNFPVTVVQAYSALEVSLTPSGFPRAGNACVNYITYSNPGNVVIPAGSIVFTHDAALSFDTGSIPGLTPTATGFTYNFTNLAPFETRNFWISMSVPSLPVVSIGQLVTNSVTVISGSLSSSASLTQPIVAAYDPNDKVESHGGKIVFADFTSEDYLYYTIRFENTGNAEAFDVRINDVLDAQLDESTVKLVSGSHPYVLERTGSELNFVFADINLPPSVANTDIGKGFVSFKVKPKSGYAIGDIIPNNASIYFDTNPAIETNTFDTQFVTTLATTTFESDSFVLYPNPANTAFQIISKKNMPIASVRIFDLLGKLILSQQPKSEESIDVQSLDAGVYFVEVNSAGKKSIQKLIVK